MPASAELLSELLALGLDLETVVNVVTLFERDASRLASRDGRDGKASAAERARQYRARQRDKSGMAGHVPRETSQSASHQSSRYASRSERDASLNTSLSSLPLLGGKEEIEKKDAAVVVEGRKPRTKRTPMPLPDNWQPSAMHHATAARLRLAAGVLESKAEDLRIWATSNDIRKANWDATFHGFLKRAASETGGGNGYRGSRPLQDDSRSVSRALDRLGEGLKQGTVQFAPRPRLVRDESESDLRLLPKG